MGHQVCLFVCFSFLQRAEVWREVTPYMHLHGNLDTIVMTAARIHNAYYVE